MRDEPFRRADAEVDRRLPEQKRHELAVNVGKMQQGDVTDRGEGEEVGLGEALLREGARPAVRRQRRGRRGNLEEIPPR